jgi:hypothetical protein
MKNVRFGETKAFWENDYGIKFGAWKHHGTLWCLCYDKFSEGKKFCPIIKDNFSTISEAVEYSETITV